ncbi:MAG TPA: OadG family protein [Kineobactrum sp.]
MVDQADIFMQGIELMVFGVGSVALFLSLLVVVTSLTSRLMTRYFPEAEPVPAVRRTSRPAPSTAAGDDALLTAVITAAVHRHRAGRH